MPAVTAPIIEPLFNALSTPEGWIGLLLGLGGRETVGYLRKFVNSLRGATSASE